MEERLDAVAEGDVPWKQVLDTFYMDFSARLGKAEQAEGGMRPNDPTETPFPTLGRGRPMMLRIASTGVFSGALATAFRRRSAAPKP